MSTGHRDKDPPPPGGLLSSALSSLQGRFGAASIPIGGTTTTRGESFVSSVSSLMGGSNVLPGGLPATGWSGINGGGATSVESPSLGELTAYEVMAGFWEQVISPVSNTMEEGEGLFAMPMGPRCGGTPDLMTGLLRSTFRALDMTTVAPPPPQPTTMMNTRRQTALQQGLGALGGAVVDGMTNREDGFDEDAIAHKSTPWGGAQGARDGTGGPVNIKLFRFDPKGAGPLICGGLVSSKKGPKLFCILTHCGLAHNKKVFDRLGNGDYYIIKSGGHGGVSGQAPQAFLEPSLPKAAAEYSPDNKEVLEATNSMEGWLSLFCYLIEAEARGDERGPNPELNSFASRARQSAFKTPLRGNGSKRSCYGAPGEEEDQDMPPIIMDLQDAIIGVQGELGVRSPSASYVTLHGSLKILGEDLRSLRDAFGEQIEVMRTSNQSKIVALKFETVQASARSQEVKRWMEQTQATGGGTVVQRLQMEMVTLKSRCNFLEGAFTQMAAFMTSLKDKVDAGGGFGAAPALSSTVFVSRPELATHMQQVKVTLDGLRQEMKGAPIEFGGHSFQGLDSCIAWAVPHMPEATYQCIPGMFCCLCLIREAVLYKPDMREDDIQAHRVQWSPMQSAVMEFVNTAMPSVLEGPKMSVLRDPKFEYGAMKTFAEWKPTNGQGGASTCLKEGLEAAWQQIWGAIDMFLGGSPVAKGHARNAHRIQDPHLSALHHGNHTLLR
jgi:hypothetical protein